MAAVANIQWQIAWPGAVGSAADTHCSICQDADTPGPILAHPLHPGTQTLVHRVHTICLLQCDQALCPECRAPYDPRAIPEPPPPSLLDRFIEDLSDCIATGSLILFFNAIILLSILPYVSPSSLLRSKTRPPIVLSPFISRAILGAVMNPVIFSLIKLPVLSLNRYIKQHINNPDSTLRKILIVATTLFVLVATILASTMLCYSVFISPFPLTARAAQISLFMTGSNEALSSIPPSTAIHGTSHLQ